MTEIASAVRSTLASPALRGWRHRMAGDWASVPRPVGSTRASTSGPSPQRILMAGSGPAAGWGVRTHDLALAGYVSRRTAALTGRGCDVDVVARTSLPLSELPRALRDARLWRYDCIIITPGIEEAARLMPRHRWEDAVSSLARFLVCSTTPSTRIVLTGVPPLQSLRGFASPLGVVVDRHARALNAVTREVLTEFPRIAYVDLPAPVAERGGNSRGFRVFEAWAQVLAPHAPSPDSSSLSVDEAVGFRDRPDEEGIRQRAVTRLGDGSGIDRARVDRVTALASVVTGARFAAVTVVDQDRQWYLSKHGFESGDVQRAASFCTHTIRRSDALVIPDAREDARVAESPLVTGPPGIRFYAGFPIESSDGYRLGSLCVFDTVPRSIDPGALVTLRDLAKAVERELERSTLLPA